ncbi:MAG: DHH family phosphoesterase [Luteitalea sp.]
MTNPSKAAVAVPSALIDALRGAGRVIVCGHARPDGDAIGSVMAMALALRGLGLPVRTVTADPAPASFAAFPAMETLELTSEVDATATTVVVMESGALSRTGIAGLERGHVVNIDHHLGNTAYGAVNWFDEGAAACGEMVADAIDAIGVPWSAAIATHLYLAVLTDTGGFRHSHLSPRSFELARRCVEAGADPVWIGQRVYDSYSLGRLRLVGALLHDMVLEGEGQIAVLTVTPDVHIRTGSTPDETDGLINLPFSAEAIRVVLMVRDGGDGLTRVSLRSKGLLDVRAIAERFGGGGHKNAAGFTSSAALPTVRDAVLPLLLPLIA